SPLRSRAVIRGWYCALARVPRGHAREHVRGRKDPFPGLPAVLRGRRAPGVRTVTVDNGGPTLGCFFCLADAECRRYFGIRGTGWQYSERAPATLSVRSKSAPFVSPAPEIPAFSKSE